MAKFFSLNLPSVAVVILNYNGSAYLQQFLPSVLLSTYASKKIYVADNASTDDSIQVLREKFSSVEIIQLDRNYGFAGGYNMALQQVHADYYLLLNSDVEVTPQWIEPLASLLQQHETVAACQPKILSYSDKTSFEYAGACGGWIDKLGYPFARGRVFDVCEKDEGQYDAAAKIFWASGAAMLIRAELFHAMNGFDTSFFAHSEEIDLCWRLQSAGYSIMCEPASAVYHVGGGTLPKGNMRKVYLNFRNNLLMLMKNLPLREKVWKLPLRFALDIAFAFKNLFTGYSASFIAIVKAHFAVMQRWLGGRIKTETARKPMEKIDGVCGSTLLWWYFIKGKNKFSEIVKKNL